MGWLSRQALPSNWPFVEAPVPETNCISVDVAAQRGKYNQPMDTTKLTTVAHTGGKDSRKTWATYGVGRKFNVGLDLENSALKVFPGL